MMPPSEQGTMQEPVNVEAGSAFLIRCEPRVEREPGVPLRVGRDAQTGLLRIEAPGLFVLLDERSVRYTLDADALTLSCGAPRWADEESADPLGRLNSLMKQGAAPWDQLRGRYAIARLDLHRRELALATDRFALHPVCYASTPEFLIASDRADTVARQIDASISLQALHDYLYFHVIPSPATIFQSVRRVEPAHLVSLSSEGTSEHRTWSPRFTEASSESLDSLAKKFVSVVQSSVQRELDDAPLGAFLSGGTDSSTVAGMLCRLRGGPAATYSIGFADEGYDEMEYARIAARHFGTRHNEYYVTPDDLLRFIPDVAVHYDQPFGNSSAVPAYCCERLAASQGVGKMFAGDGGDELFGGNTRYAKQKIFGAYGILPAAVRTGVLEPIFTGDSLLRKLPLLSKVGSYIEQARVPMPERMETYNLLARFGTSTVLSEAVLEKVDCTAPIGLQRRIYGECSDSSLVNRMLAYDWRFTLADTDLPKVVGTASLAGVRVAFPLIDDDLVDFSMTLSASMKVRGLRLRWLFKKALSDFLPAEILRKKKHGFGLPFGPWLVRHDGLRHFAQDSLDGLAQRNVINGDFVKTLFSTHLAQHPGYYGEMIWILMVLEQWLRARAPDFSVPAA